MQRRLFLFLKFYLLHLQWLCSGNVLVRGGAGQRQADLWGAVFCCVVVNYGLACVTLPAATFTFHPLLTLKNIDYIHTPLIALFQTCQMAGCRASFNQGLLCLDCVFIVNYSCVFWTASEFVCSWHMQEMCSIHLL